MLPLVKKPARYIGNEANIVRKDPGRVDIRMAVSYPDVYEVGMSNLGIRTIYDAVNRVKNFYCERIFAPWGDFEEKLREKRIPIYSLETFTPLGDFDVVGFSVGSELLYTNILCILDLAGIPLFAKQRGEKDPLVIAGGPAVANPEPIADFVDVFVFGDGEVAIIELLNAVWSVKGESRGTLLSELDRLGFTYVPSLYAQKEKDGLLFTDIDKIVRRRIEPDLDRLVFPDKPIVPLTKIVQDRACIAVSRGCGNGCRFCQAGYTYRPLRERSVGSLLRMVDETIRNTGYDELSLLSLSIGDYSCLKELVSCIMEYYEGKRLSLSLPSLRVNSTNLDILNMIGRVRKSGLTFAVESADPRVRMGINKKVDITQLREIVGWVVRAGWRHLKLYFMIGLPMARDEQEWIHDFVDDLLGISKKLSINLNVSTFVPKPHTPFERERQLGMDDAKRLIDRIRKGFAKSRVKVKFQSPYMSHIEGILSRGDRRIGTVVHEAYMNGERFSSWDEIFDYSLWQGAMERLGIEKNRYLEFDDTATLPWAFMNCGVTGRFLREEKTRAYGRSVEEGCRSGGCQGCGVCDDRIKTDLADAKGQSERSRDFIYDGKKRSSPLRRKILFRFEKTGELRFISHLDLMEYLIRIGRRADIPFRYSEGFNPRPRLVLPFPLPLGLESSYELGEVLLENEISAEDFVARYNDLLDDRVKIQGAEASYRKGSIAGTEFYHDYKVFLPPGSDESIKALISKIRSGGGGVRAKAGDGLPGHEPLVCFSVMKDTVLMRLGPKQSIRKVLEDYRYYSVERTMIWELRGGTLREYL